MIKVLSNINYTIRKIGTRYTQTLHIIRIRPYVPEQHVPDVTVRANEYLPDPDVKVSHNEWYAVSWEMDFGKQIDEHEMTRSAENNQQIVTQEVANTHDDTITQQISDNQNEDTHDVAPTSPDFSNLTTDVGDNPYIRRPLPIESSPIPRRSPPTTVGYNPRKTAKYNLRPNPKPNANPDFRRLDAMTTTHYKRKDNIRSLDRTDLTNYNSRHTTAFLLFLQNPRLLLFTDFSFYAIYDVTKEC